MTYKYRYVRRELYESNPEKKLKSYRSLSEMSRLIRWPMWAMAAGFVLLTFCLAWILITKPLNALSLVPSTAVILLALAASLSREKLFYHLPAREKELAEQQQNYAAYLAGIRAVLIKHGIDGPDKLRKLKGECEALLKAREEKYTRVHRSIVSTLIGVPVGALLTGLIHQDSGVAFGATAAVLLIGVLIFGLAKLFSTIDYYSSEYFKDQNLLDAISEVEYADRLFEEAGGARADGEEARGAENACAT